MLENILTSNNVLSNIQLFMERFHPGIYIKDELEAREMTIKEFSLLSGISKRTLSNIFNGGSISSDVAYKLSKFFGNSVDFWINIQNAYDLYQKEENIQLETK